MLDLKDLKLNSIEDKVFEYFQNICDIPHGSSNRVPIADFCESFAKSHNFKFIRDSENNVIIFKDGQNGLENTQPIILQGHLDMVCQATDDKEINFLTQPIEIMRDGDYITADGTTLGADNGIAVAYILAILDSSDICHPPIEAIFTADEEIGLLGANALDTSVLSAKRMINLDSETEDVLTVSCAGGQDVILKNIYDTAFYTGVKLTIKINGLLGGHSGVEINKGRTNANVLLGNLLKFIKGKTDFKLININGGNKPNAIPDYSTAEICVQNPECIQEICKDFYKANAPAIDQNEPDFNLSLTVDVSNEYTVLCDKNCDDLIKLLTTVPDGVIKMSEEINGLVETSLNLGVMRTLDGFITCHYALRSNKKDKLEELTHRVVSIGETANFTATVSGFYPAWEYNPNSPLRELYKKCYKDMFQKEIKVEAIHAGLECAVFSSTIKNLDCISVGPTMYEVHTPNERLSIRSAVGTFRLLLKVLENNAIFD